MRAALALFLLACSEPRVCPPFEPNARDPLSIEGAREAHRWAALARRLRFEEARSPGYVLRLTALRTEGDACFSDRYIAGRILFEHPMAPHDGLGDQLAEVQPYSPFRRVQEGRFGGPDTNTCRSCHWRGGTAGAGDLPDAAMLYGDGDLTSSADGRNPPALHGAGAIEALARQITADLRALRDEAIEEAGRGVEIERALIVDGVDYGLVRAHPDGTADVEPIGVDADLVVRPFGWKGTFASLREIIDAAFQIHMGMQSEVLLESGDLERLGNGAAHDPDRDGVAGELTEGQLDAVVAFVAARGLPIFRPHERIDDLGPIAENLIAPTSTIYLEEWARGRALFDTIGCAECHTPRRVLRDPVLPIGAFTIDLAREAEHPRIAHDEEVGGYPIFLFSDLRRHDLGAENASRHVDSGVGPQLFLTRPLWGLADSAPYSHDGRSPTIDHAIERHGGEGSSARDAFRALAPEDRGAVRIFLMSLRRQWRPLVPP